jgi:hypothetical protein
MSGCPFYVPTTLSRIICQIDLSKLSCLKSPVCTSRMYCYGCPATIVLSWLSCPSCPVLTCPSTLAKTAVLSLLSCSDCLVIQYCPGCLVFAVLSLLSCSGHCVSVLTRLVWPVARLTRPSYPVPNILPRLSCPGCAPVVLSLLTCPGCPVPVNLSWMSYLSCSVLNVCLAILSFRSYPG